MTTYISSKLSVLSIPKPSPRSISIRETATSVIRYKMASYLSALSSILIIMLLLSVVHHSGASWGWGCRGPKNEGTRFGKPKRMWWYNSETDQCEAFTYLGSGGNANRHPWVHIANIKLQTFETLEQGMRFGTEDNFSSMIRYMNPVKILVGTSQNFWEWTSLFRFLWG